MDPAFLIAPHSSRCGISVYIWEKGKNNRKIEKCLYFEQETCNIIL